MDLYIYRDFELQGVVTAYKSLKWTRRYNVVGDFELEMMLTAEDMALLAKDNIIYKKDTKEAAIILGRNIFTDAFGDERLIVRGKFLNKILDRRIASYSGTASLQSIINSMVNQNMISASNPKRNISGMVIKNVTLLNNPSATVEFKNVELLQAVTTLCQQYGIGFKINYNATAKQYELELYEGLERTDVAFSKQFNNVLDQEYFQDTGSHKNTCLVDIEGAITTVGDSNTGLSRKEVYTTFNTSSTESTVEQGKTFLQSYKQMESMDTVIDTNSVQFLYLKDWDLGDIVTCKNAKWGVTIQRNILEIEEFYDTTGKYITVVFGDYIPTIKGK